MYCRKCGAQLPDGVKFCRYCGTEQEPLRNDPKNTGPKYEPVAPARPSAEASAPKKSHTAVIVLCAVLGILLLVLGGIFLGNILVGKESAAAPNGVLITKTGETSKADTAVEKDEMKPSSAAESAKKNEGKTGTKTGQPSAAAPAAPEKTAEERAYEEAEAMLQSGRIVSAYDAFTALGTYSDSASRAAAIKTEYPVCFTSVGNYIEFGSYEQDGKSGKEPIEWLVLEKGSDYVVLISRYALANRLYHETKESVTWAGCDLRKWLNNSFYRDAFSAEQQALIAESSVITGGTTTNDKVYLLSVAEAESYFGSDSARGCKPTKTATNSGAVTGNNGNVWWWLRSPGKSETAAAGVFGRGAIDYDGDTVNYLSSKTGKAPNGVRPVIRVTID